MKKLSLLLVVLAGSALSGCVAYEVPVASTGYSTGNSAGYYGGYRNRDRDGDGVPNRYDRRPDNPYRY
jgi:hypothetical protein